MSSSISSPSTSFPQPPSVKLNHETDFPQLPPRAPVIKPREITSPYSPGPLTAGASVSPTIIFQRTFPRET